MMEAERPPLLPFITVEAAIQKVRLAEDAWNYAGLSRRALAVCDISGAGRAQLKRTAELGEPRRGDAESAR